MDTSSGDERRAVVVEDDEDIRELLEFTLTTQGFKVLAVGSGLAAVEAVREHQPDLVTLDLGLPGIDGIEVCRRIRDISDAYVVMITARDEEIDRLLGLETGADDFIAKPFSARELRARVNAMFRRPRTGLGAAPVVGSGATVTPAAATTTTRCWCTAYCGSTWTDAGCSVTTRSWSSPAPSSTCSPS